MHSFTDIFPHIAPCLLVIFRIGGLMLWGPVFGSSVVPVRVRVLLAFLIGLMCYPLLDAQVLGDTPLQLQLFMLAPMIAVEIMIGLVIGYLASLPMVAVQTGGLVMGQQMGLGFARFYNPAVDDEADVVGQLLFFLALAIFLSIGGHEIMVYSVLRSFEHVPLGGFTPDIGMLDLIAGLLLAAMDLALRVAAPLLAIIFLESLAMGFISKTVPQLNILSLGFPLRILAGFALVAVGITIISDVLLANIEDTLEAMVTWIEHGA